MKKEYNSPKITAVVANFDALMLDLSNENPYNGEQVLVKEGSSEEDLYEIFLGWD